MDDAMASTRMRLITTAAQLFRRKGYHGTGLAEILAEAQAPKGSLYHHFPSGKPDLALAAADWASAGMLTIIAEAFGPAPSYAQGAATLCHKLAKFFDISGASDGCPVSAVLFDAPDNFTFRAKADEIFGKWTRAIAYHAIRLGEDEGQAEARAEMLLVALQGGWVLARTKRSSEVLRRLPGHLGLV